MKWWHISQLERPSGSKYHASRSRDAQLSLDQWSRKEKFDKVANLPAPPPVYTVRSSAYLQDHLYRKDASEDVVEVGEDVVSFTLLLHWILGRQGDATQNNDDHDEGVETGDGHDAVHEDANAIIIVLRITYYTQWHYRLTD